MTLDIYFIFPFTYLSFDLGFWLFSLDYKAVVGGIDISSSFLVPKVVEYLFLHYVIGVRVFTAKFSSHQSNKFLKTSVSSSNHKTLQDLLP